MILRCICEGGRSDILAIEQTRLVATRGVHAVAAGSEAPHDGHTARRVTKIATVLPQESKAGLTYSGSIWPSAEALLVNPPKAGSDSGESDVTVPQSPPTLSGILQSAKRLGF
jgi:hypothetical protein